MDKQELKDNMSNITKKGSENETSEVDWCKFTVGILQMIGGIIMMASSVYILCLLFES